MEKRIASDVAFTPSVKAEQDKRGSRDGYARMEEKGGWSDRINAELTSFIAERNSFYLGTSNAEGQPYIQHRGGPKGFLKVLDERRLAFADFGGNKQYITLGNLADNQKAFIFLMDYANQRRIKVWGHAEIVEDDPDLLDGLSDERYQGTPERAIVFHVSAWDVNCPQHIMRRFSEMDLARPIGELKARIVELEAENARLRDRLADPA